MKRGLVCLCACALGVAARADEAVAKTWAVTLPADAAGLTNNAPVTLTDGSYVLKGYIRDAAKRYLAIGGCAAPVDAAAGHALMRDAAGAIIGTGPLDLRGAVTVNGAPSAWTIAHIGLYAFLDEKSVPFASVPLPTTLRSMDMATFQGCGEVRGDYGVYRGMFAGGGATTWRDGKEVLVGGGTYTGTLHLPSLATVQSNAFHNATRLEAAELGSNTVVTSMPVGRRSARDLPPPALGRCAAFRRPPDPDVCYTCASECHGSRLKV